MQAIDDVLSGLPVTVNTAILIGLLIMTYLKGRQVVMMIVHKD